MAWKIQRKNPPAGQPANFRRPVQMRPPCPVNQDNRWSLILGALAEIKINVINNRQSKPHPEVIYSRTMVRIPGCHQNAGRRTQ